MKKSIIITFLLITTGNVFAQREKIINLPDLDKHRFHYGFYLGGNKNSFKISYKPSHIENPNIEVESQIGFNIGLIADMRVNNNFNLRFEPGLISNTKKIAFNHINDDNWVKNREIGNTYLHLPLILKFSVNRLRNIRPYVLGGASYNYNFSSDESNGDDNFAGIFRQKSNVFMYELGIGMEFYLPYFKFSPSIRGLFSITNELTYDNEKNGASQWTDPIDFYGTRGVFIHLSFEGGNF